MQILYCLSASSSSLNMQKYLYYIRGLYKLRAKCFSLAFGMITPSPRLAKLYIIPLISQLAIKNRFQSFFEVSFAISYTFIMEIWALSTSMSKGYGILQIIYGKYILSNKRWKKKKKLPPFLEIQPKDIWVLDTISLIEVSTKSSLRFLSRDVAARFKLFMIFLEHIFLFL